MRKILILVLGLLAALIFILPGRYVYTCVIMGNCAPDKSFSLSLMDGNTAILKGYQHLSFDPSSISPNLTPNNKEYLDKVAEYLKANPDKNLTISGSYRSSEQGESSGIFENLGLARANAIRDLLIQRGIDVNRFSLDHVAIANDNLAEPIKFELFIPKPDDYDEDGGLVKVQFRFDNMTFSDANFEFNSAIFKPGAAFNVWADSVFTFFELNPDKSLDVVGHTDNVGTIIYNQDLGLRRAQAAKAFFTKKGVKADIKTASRGEKLPIAPNATPAGRQKNRRVNFIIK